MRKRKSVHVESLYYSLSAPSGFTGSNKIKISRESNQPDSTSDAHGNKKKKQTLLDLQSSLHSSTSLPTHVDLKCVTIHINGFSEET